MYYAKLLFTISVGTGVLDGPSKKMPLRGRTVREAGPYKGIG